MKIIIQYHISGGAEENRTPVRKQVHPSFSECRLWLSFPLPQVHNQTNGIGSLYVMTRHKAMTRSRSPLVFALT